MSRIQVVVAVVAVLAFTTRLAAADEVEPKSKDRGTAFLGGLGYWSGIIYDIATAGRAVDDYNQRLHVRVMPTVIPTASSGPAVGLGITGSF